MLSKFIGAKNLIVSSVDPYLTMALVRVSLQADLPFFHVQSSLPFVSHTVLLLFSLITICHSSVCV